MTDNIKATIEFLIELIGIDARSEIVYARMTQKLSELGDNLTRFLHYCEKYHDHEAVRYLSSYGRFNALHKRFVDGLQTIEQKTYLDAYEAKAKAIVDKLKAIKHDYEMHIIQKQIRLDFHNFRKEGASLFSDEEVRIVTDIYASLGIAIQQIADFGRDKAEEEIVKYLAKSKRPMLVTGKVSQILQKAGEATSA